MIDLAVKNLKKYYSANMIFDHVTFDVKSGEKIGLIGANGSGKTTILKIVAGMESAEGELFLRKGLTLGYLEQLPIVGMEDTVRNVLNTAFDELNNLKQKITQYELLLAQDTENFERTLQEYGKLQAEFERLEGYSIDEKINRIIKGLDLDNHLGKKFNDLSGGERTKVMLGKVLLMNPDLLLLDEPTNHLDLSSVEWLELFLREYKGSVLLVSHDRYFLDNVIDKILDIDENGVETYHGNYSYYVLEKERRFYEAMKWYGNQQKKIKRMEDQIHRYRVWGEMRDSDKMYRRAKELEKRLEKITLLDKPVLERKKINLSGLTGGRTGKSVITADNISKSYDDQLILSSVNFELFYGDSFALIGDNGSGKTTLLQMITQEINPDAGQITIGARVEMGYLPQKVTFSDEEKSVLDTYINESGTTLSQGRHDLAKILFYGDDVFKRVNMLSGGEKSRLRLSIILNNNANLLILDEPTNHLDIDSREILEETLSDYQGTIFFVSHDRYFINKLADRIGEIKDKTVLIYEGDYSYYKDQKIMEQAKPKINIDEAINLNTKRSVADSNIITAKPVKTIQKKQTALEAEIMELEDAINNLETEMEKNPTDHEILGRLYEEKGKAENLYLEKLMEHEKITNELKSFAEKEEKIR
ncbi:MAG: ABC-F family ATP-binding cassette domain-containing protein [Dethiosulfatibacter sp.]|nr:ABC-F family ATP-binding cassette domain-containing protein [Dethiosulfatibacter sp.]